jgi:hypothetical protein
MAFDFAYVIKQSFVILFSDYFIFALAVIYTVASVLFALSISSPISSFITSKGTVISNVSFLVIYMILFMLFSVFLQDITFIRVFNKNKNIKYTLKMAVYRFPVFLATDIITGVIVTLGFIAFIIPGIYLLFKFILAPVSSAVEKKSPLDALRRSWQLTRGNWWVLFAVFLILGIIVSILSLLPYISYFFEFIIIIAYPLSLMQLAPNKKLKKKRTNPA